MNDDLDSSIASTTESVRAAVATHEDGDVLGELARASVHCPGSGKTFQLGVGVTRGAGGRPYERRPGDPLYRPLRIYTVDPGTRLDEGAVAVVNVPYEPLEHGLRGHVFHVMPVLRQPRVDGPTDTVNVDLNHPFLLLVDGRAPSPVDPLFHQQMVYAVASLVYASFRRALGRHVGWGFGPHVGDGNCSRLRLSPHGRPGSPNASYEPERGEILFGFVQTEDEGRGRAVPDGHTFNCVSHDIVAHEVTHALIDGLRVYFTEPTNGDVLGFHEGFADLIALLHRFSYTEVVRAAMRHARGNLLQSEVLTSIAIEFGLNTGRTGGVRRVNAVEATAATKASPNLLNGERPDDGNGLLREYKSDLEAHEMGQVLVSAVFHAFSIVYAHKTDRYLRLATGGTGVLPEGEIPADLRDVLAEEASQLASQFLNVCIRALDYCPPVDVHLSDFLRAVITADLDLVPDDPWGYREAWIDAFALHRIYPSAVQCMCENELRWDSFELPETRPETTLTVPELSFTKLAFDCDPASAASPGELRRRACALGKFVAANPEKFDLVSNGDARLKADGAEDPDEVTVPEVQSVRSSRRVGPDGQVVFDLVAEVTQVRKVEGDYRFLLRGGCTIILGPRGEVRYVISKKVTSASRIFQQRMFMESPGGSVHVTTRDDGWKEVSSRSVWLQHRDTVRSRGPRSRSEDL